jgi:hypothetical protein
MKTHSIIGVLAVAFAASLGMTVLGANDDRGHDDEDSRAQVGLAYARAQKIPLRLRGRDRELVGLGSYLVNAVGGCNDCHTAPPFTKDPYAFLGAPKQVNVDCYLAGGSTFGPFVSRDITPWEKGLPAGLTFKAFRHVIRTGEDPDRPGQVLQVMPWPVYQAMTDNDLRAIYEFLLAIPAIEPNTCGAPSE